MFKSQTYYVRIKENEFIIKSVINPKEITIKAEEPFTTKRLLIGQFSVAEKFLTIGLEQFNENFLFAPMLIMHPLENIDEELSEVEEKVLKELALSSGAKEAKLWLGEELSDKDLRDI